MPGRIARGTDGLFGKAASGTVDGKLTDNTGAVIPDASHSGPGVICYLPPDRSSFRSRYLLPDDIEHFFRGLEGTFRCGNLGTGGKQRLRDARVVTLVSIPTV